MEEGGGRIEFHQAHTTYCSPTLSGLILMIDYLLHDYVCTTTTTTTYYYHN